VEDEAGVVDVQDHRSILSQVYCSKVVSIAAGVLLLAGCATTPTKTSGRVRVVTTLGILADWARQVGGDRVEVTSLLTGNESPHTYEIKPADVKLVADARILFRIGFGLEDWLDPAVENSGNTRLVVVDASDGITDVIVDEGHQPKSEVRNQKSEARTPETLTPSPQSPAPFRGGNPHIWLDPEYAKAGIENLVRELVKLDPKGESLYRRRESAYCAQLDSLSQAIKAQVATLQDKRFISFHDAWPYFCRRFGLQVVATVEPIPGQEPSAKQLARMVDLIRHEHIKVVTTEPQMPSALPDMLAKETGVKVVSLNPLESEGGYIAALGKSADALINALR
jgi:ABC-type Zn uptake system ZnuABC Zn-binding protein ZnuA